MMAASRVAITGGIASGKSTVGKVLRELGVPVIDTDDVVHTLYREDAMLQGQLASLLGADVLEADPSSSDKSRLRVCRPVLAKFLFSDPELKERIECLVHPRVRSVVHRFVETHDAHTFVGILIPQLFETQTERLYERVWLVAAPEVLQYHRLVTQRGLSSAEAWKRIHSQMPLEDKLQRCRPFLDTVIHNKGTLDDLVQQVQAAHLHLKQVL
ncbi:MAG: dephospho-CoA kinase [Vampirovibrionales bacterium]